MLLFLLLSTVVRAAAKNETPESRLGVVELEDEVVGCCVNKTDAKVLLMPRTAVVVLLSPCSIRAIFSCRYWL